MQVKWHIQAQTPTAGYTEWKEMPIQCQSVLADWTSPSAFRHSLAFSATFCKLVDNIVLMCRSFLLNANWLLIYTDQNHEEFLWDWPFALCYLISFLINIYTYLKSVMDCTADKREKKWMNSKNQKGHSIPTDNLGKSCVLKRSNV